MKGWIAAAVLLVLMTVGVTANAACVRGAGRALQADLSALPDVTSALGSSPDPLEANPSAPNPWESAPLAPDPEALQMETAAAVAALRGRFEERAAYLRITVPASTLEEIRQGLTLLECYARAGAWTAYSAARRLLSEQAEALSRSEELTWENLL